MQPTVRVHRMLRHLEEDPMRALALTILTTGMVLTSGHSRAQTYDPAFPVCLYVVAYGATPYYRCSYHTMDECRASANGQMCVLNPYYAGATATMKGRSAAHAKTRSYVPPKSPIRARSAPYNQSNEPYYGASQGYAPGEKQQFLESVRRSL
ncbi:DUF3551 domain-containing protein [Bradyrhizobium sp. DASA03076]|uniref:DUF3551 domain-containing protein n=1 Tax=Bradyrhizobium sp. BLXBL-03 TaxID=3395916 RepID=UPI003F72CD4B